MKKIVTKVQEYPHTTLAVIGILGTYLIAQSIKLSVSRLETHQVIRAAEDLGLDQQLVQKMEDHGPYYRNQ